MANRTFDVRAEKQTLRNATDMFGSGEADGPFNFTIWVIRDQSTRSCRPLDVRFDLKAPNHRQPKGCVWPDAHDSTRIFGARIMRYELADCEWVAIKPMLPNKPRGVPRVNDRRVFNGIFWVLRSGALAGRNVLREACCELPCVRPACSHPAMVGQR